MRRSIILLSLIIMSFSVNAYAQEKNESPVQWTIAGHLPAFNNKPSPGVAGPVTGILGNTLLIGGGANFPDSMPWMGGRKKYHDRLYIYECRNDTFLLKELSLRLPAAIAYTANCTSSAGIVYAGGENGNGISNKVTLVAWDAQQKRVIFQQLPNLPVAVTNAGAVAFEHMIFVGGGETAHAVSHRFFRLDLSKPGAGWKELQNIPKPVSHAVWIVSNATDGPAVYVIGGRKKSTNGISTLYRSVYRYDINQDSWHEMASLPYALSAGTGMALNNENIMVFGGDKGETFHETEKLLAAISDQQESESKRAMLIKQKNELQAAHPGFSRKILLYNIQSNEWKAVGCMPFETPVTTTAVDWHGNVVLPSGEIRAGVRTPRVLLGKIKLTNRQAL